MFANMNNEELRNILKATILKKLKRRGKWGHAHTSLDKLTSGIPKGLAKDVAKELIKEVLLLAKPTSYGLEVSLNPRRKAEIDKIIEEYLDKE